MSSIVVDECLQKSERDDEIKTCYFYCKESQGNGEDQNNTNTCIAVLRNLLHQLVEYCPDLQPTVSYKRNLSNQAIAQPEDVKSLLENFLAEKQIFIIIDGVDECRYEERKQIIQYFTDKEAKNNARCERKLRVLLVSQCLPDIQKILQASNANAKTVDICSDDAQIKEDIAAYVDTKLHQLTHGSNRSFHQLDQEPISCIRKMILHYSSKLYHQFFLYRELVNLVRHVECEGMFVYARRVMKNLESIIDDKDLHQEIQNFPQTLTEAYVQT